MALVVQHTSISTQFLCLASGRNKRNVRWQELTYHDGFPTFAFSYGLKGSYRIQNIFAHPCEFLGLFGSYLEAVVFIFWGFSEDFRRFSKIVPKTRKTFPNISRRFRAVSDDNWRLQKIAEDDRRRSKDVSIIHQKFKSGLKGQQKKIWSPKWYLHLWGYISYFTCDDIIYIGFDTVTRYANNFGIIKQFVGWNVISQRIAACFSPIDKFADLGSRPSVEKKCHFSTKHFNFGLF